MKDFFDDIKKTDLSEQAIYDYISDWVDNKQLIEQYTKKDLLKIATFLWQIQHHRALKFLLVKCFNKISNMPGNVLFHFVHTFKSSLDDFDEQNFVALNDHFNLFKVYNTPFLVKSHTFTEAQEQQLEIYEKRHFKIKEDLVDKLEFARTQRLDKEAKKTLDKLLEAFPNDPRFVNEKQQLFEKEAAQIIDEHAKKQKSSTSRHIVIEPKKESTSHLYQLFLQSFDAHPESLIHLIEIFILAYEAETVVEIFETHPTLKQKHFWIYIEHLIKIERYLEALAELKQHQDKITSSTESIFTFYYYHAICLWYLNDKQRATDIMKAIQQNRPNFRQTHFYLNLWQRHDKVG